MTRPAVIVVALLALGAAIIAGASWGTIGFSPAAILSALAHPHAQTDASTVLWSLRLPRVAIAALVGAALAVAGLLMQDLLGNPLIDPYLTGTSAGAALAIAVAIALGAPPALYSAIALCASLATTLLVAALSRAGTGLSVERMIVAGIALSSLFAGLTTLVILWSPSASVSLSILAWLGGSLAGHGWRDLGWAVLYAACGLALALTTIPALNALRLGTRRAQALGVDLDRTRWLVVLSACLLTSAAVSVSGVIGFVGLMVPHIVRGAIGHDVRWTIAAALPVGAIVLILADTFARSATPPTEIPLGILLSLLGVPAFLYLASRRAKPV
ncbi:MAG TPA: iron ABC transporter permease [Candidatus Baltobacteraceae bacterium]|jgi:iron complex transport system permease protein